MLVTKIYLYCSHLVISIKYIHTNREFLLRQLWIINCYIKSSSNKLSNENINTGVSDVSDVFKTKRELKYQNELFLKFWYFFMRQFRVTILEGRISLSCVQKFLVLLGAVDMSHLLLKSKSRKNCTCTVEIAPPTRMWPLKVNTPTSPFGLLLEFVKEGMAKSQNYFLSFPDISHGIFSYHMVW